MERWRPARLVVHVTNMPTPYRIHFCNALWASLQEQGYGLCVLYCCERERNRTWSVDFAAMCYPHQVLPGLSPAIGGLEWHLNPSVVTRLRQLRPEFTLIAGGWNMPTAILAASRILSGPSLRVFWSEGHAGAVLHPSGPIAWLRRRCLAAYDAFAVPNAASAQFIESQLGFRPPILPLPNTVDEEFYRAARSLDKQEVRRRLGVPADATVLLSVAQLVEHKGVRELALAMMRMAGEGGALVLVLVGGGPLRPELEALALQSQGRVVVVGPQSASQVRAWYAAADALVLASKYDPNPLVVVEAAFAGLPLVVSQRAGNAPELVRDGVSGMLIPSIDSSTIAAVLSRFCALDPSQRRAMGARASELAEAGFQTRAVAARFVEALLALRRAR